MSKTNFSRAEESLAAILEKMKVEELLSRADKAAGKEKLPVSKEKIQIVHTLQRQLKYLHRNDPEIYKKLKVKRKDLERVLEHIDNLTDAEWSQLITFKEKINAYMKSLASETDEKIVESERHKHINKRFNVSDKWLPLK